MCREIAPQGHFLALRAQCATSACGLLAMTNLRTSRHRMCAAKIASLHGAQGTPLQTQLVHTVLTAAVMGCMCSAGPGCPLPSLSKKFLWTFWTSCFQNCKIKFCSMILQFCRCGGLFDVKGNPDGFLSHYSSLRNFPLSVFHLRHVPHFSLQFTDSRHSAACLPGRRAGFPR